jgi:acyl transferase domain-containing protein
LAGKAGFDPGDVGFSLATSRAVFENRAVIVGGEPGELLSELDALARGMPAAGIAVGDALGGTRRLACLFTGQGAQRVGMGRELYGASPVFRDAFDEVCGGMDALLGRSLRELVFGGDETQRESDYCSNEGTPLDETGFTQAGLFALEVALFRVVQALGVRPDYLLGHSIGELVAAYVAQMLSLEDACTLVAARGRLMGALPEGGAMVAVQASEREALAEIEGSGDVALASVNGGCSVVYSGEEGAVLALAELWARRGRKTKRLRVSHAFHSHRMDGMLEQFADVVARLSFSKPRIPIVSNLTGEPLSSEQARDPRYWIDHVRHTVRFADGIRWLGAQGVDKFLELGPDGVLSAMCVECLSEEAAPEEKTGGVSIDGAVDRIGEDRTLTAVSILREGRAEARSLAGALAELWVGGVPVDWAALFDRAAVRRVKLPTYAFQRERYWIDSSPTALLFGEGGTASDRQAGETDEKAFWDAVEREDLDDLSNTLELEEDEQNRSLRTLMASLSSWRRRSRQQAAVGGWRYRMHWKPMAAASTPVLTETWLAIVPATLREDRRIVELMGALRASGAELLPVTVDAAISREELVVRLRDVVDRSEGARIGGVISLLAFQEDTHPACTAVPVGLADTVALTQALEDVDMPAPLWLLTRGAVSIGPSDRIRSASQAHVWGAGFVVGLEYPHRWGGLIDLPDTLDERTGALLIDALSHSGGEDQLAIRAAGKFARRLARSRHDGQAAHSAWTAPGGTCLITGGTGGLGAHVARWLARSGANHLLLVSRRGGDAPEATRLRTELTELGAEVTIAACDVADREQLAALIDSLSEDRKLDVVVHAAGTGSPGAIATLSVSDLEQTLSAKALGARHLDELTEHLQLSAFVLFSSIAGTFGSALQAPYAAANAFLDALAADRRGRGLAGTSVAWGPWDGEGMAAEKELGDALQRHGIERMEPRLAIEALRGALLAEETFLAVADLRWEVYAPIFTLARPRPLIEDLPEVAAVLEADQGPADELAGSELRARLREVAPEHRAQVLLQLVRGEAAYVLGHSSADAVDPRRSFKELGFDSLSALVLRDRLSSATNLRLPTTLVFNYPSGAALAAYLLQRIADEGLADATPVGTQLERLESAIATAVMADDERTAIQTRLQALLVEVGGASGAAEGIADARDLASATADEVIDYIRELGVS